MDLGEVIDEVVTRMLVEIERSGSTIAVHKDGPLVGTWDRLLLDRVVTNLVSNAVKFGQGKSIEIRASAAGASVRVSVIDHGIGIAPELHAKIFEAFERAVPVRHYGGLGLGLYIVRTAVDAMGGTTHLTSAPGNGAAFTVELPVHRTP